ncbi:glyoxylase I family protein [Tenacibaculum skagerrakense]|uniref:Glyoxylase I family protein n=1 Tax=Tenacibaculum skagerrakense TaxID=186571 RepID=A0A4R2NQE7_9FLAO|nr:VOC family protein [Tenacibaculum skagerrakense]TCP23598.1 glyoxylase I family protein [Tenacibaculum skagerrakense]
MKIEKLHHVAIICSNYEVSKRFYTKVLGFEIQQEVFREERASYKLDLCLNGTYVIELFSFPNPPKRASFPEATGLRHIAFAVKNLEEWKVYLESNEVSCQEIRVDEFTGKRFFFFNDPDNLPIELYEI